MSKKNKIGILLILIAFAAGTFTVLRVRKIQDEGLALTTEPELVEGATVGGVVIGGKTAVAVKPITSTTKSQPTSDSNTSLPDTLSIPKIRVNADVEYLGVTKSGNMAAPANFTNVSWYKYGTVPGEVGSAVMAGHDNGIYVRGVFRSLGNLKVGDDVYVVAENGEKLHFRVIETAIYPYDKAPLQKIFTRNDGSYLVLITCTGDWIPEKKMSDHRIVVYTKLVK